MMEPNTSHLESNGQGISYLLEELAIMSKKVSLDSSLSKVLEDFLDKLNSSDLFLANGIANTNFAEAALLLQSSAEIYGKKVDLLWDYINDHQKRLLEYNKREEENVKEIEKLEKRRQKYKRKKTANKETDANHANDFSFGSPNGNHDALTHEYEPADLLGEWARHFKQNPNRTQNQRIFVNKNSEFLPDNSIYSAEDNEYVGKYNQFISSSLLEEIFCLDERNLPKEDKCVSRIRIDSYVINNFLWERSIPCTAPLESYIDDLRKYISEFVHNRTTVNQKDGYEDFCSRLTHLNRKRCFVNVERLPVDVVQEKIRRFSVADSMFGDNVSLRSCDLFNDDDLEKGPGIPTNDDAVRPPSTVYSELNGSFKSPEIPGNLEKRNQSCSQDSAFYDEDDMDASLRLTPFSTTCQTPKSVVEDNRKFLASSAVVILKRLPLNPRKIDELHKEKFINKGRKKRISSKKLMKLTTGITADLNNFERFFCKQYKSADGEGEPPQLESEPDESDDEMNNDDGDFEREEIREEHEEPSSSGHPEEVPVTPIFPIEETAEIREEEPCSSRFRPSLIDLERQDDLHKRVQEWKKFILPKLKEAANKPKFNIHEYSSEIVDRAEIGESFYFKDVVREKSPGDVARLFMATLTLANTRNIEIGGVQDGVVCNDTFRVKVLDKTQHHELLEEYHAPSEQAFREKLEHVKALNPRVILHSTPSGPSPAKKAKMGVSSSKRLFC